MITSRRITGLFFKKFPPIFSESFKHIYTNVVKHTDAFTYVLVEQPVSMSSLWFLGEDVHHVYDYIYL